jgi:hypothetical protein
MGLVANKIQEVISFASMIGGVNINDPEVSLNADQVSKTLNAMFLKKGFKRWPGVQNLTTKGDCNNLLRGIFHHSEISDTQHLFTVFGGYLYEVNKTTGALTLLYNVAGDGEAWGCSQYGTFFIANGSSFIKVEGSTAYHVGIAAPTAATSALVAGGTLTDGLWQIFLSNTRQSVGLDLLYSVGQLVTSRTCGTGNNTIRITFPNAALTDPQVTHVTVWMSGPADSNVFYKYGEAAITAGTVDISTVANKNPATTYSAMAQNNQLPLNFTYIFAHNNQLFGILGNKLYYSMKLGTKYGLERWPTNNYIEYPFQLTGGFSVGENICLNTVENGVITIPNGDVSAQYKHYEKATSFRFMRTVADWNGNKIGITNDRIAVFDAQTYTFREWDYSYNIRPVLERVWTTSNLDTIPCGVIYRRGNRIEYEISFMDTAINSSCNNRTYVLNLSRTIFNSIDDYRTPWEVVGRGFNYAVVGSNNLLFMGQSFAGSSTIYKESTTHTTQVGIYDDAGIYIDTATKMKLIVRPRTIIKNMFTKATIENVRAMFQINEPSSLNISIVDNPAAATTQTTSTSAEGQSLWDDMLWSDDTETVGNKWSAEYQQQYEFKGELGMRGYSWYIEFSQEADDKDMQITQFDVLVELETGRGI